jgi:hypothetical protein
MWVTLNEPENGRYSFSNSVAECCIHTLLKFLRRQTDEPDLAAEAATESGGPVGPEFMAPPE